MYRDAELCGELDESRLNKKRKRGVIKHMHINGNDMLSEDLA